LVWFSWYTAWCSRAAIRFTCQHYNSQDRALVHSSKRSYVTTSNF
jgi:hypothetical protein